MPFARVAQHGFLQPNVSSRDNRFNGVQIHVMSLDTNYTAITPSQCVLSHREITKPSPASILYNRNGTVNFSLQSMNMNSALSTAASVRRRHWRARSRDGSRHDGNIHQHQRDVIGDALNGP
jgi:hypothetical protein